MRRRVLVILCQRILLNYRSRPYEACNTGGIFLAGLTKEDIRLLNQIGTNKIHLLTGWATRLLRLPLCEAASTTN